MPMRFRQEIQKMLWQDAALIILQLHLPGHNVTHPWTLLIRVPGVCFQLPALLPQVKNVLNRLILHSEVGPTQLHFEGPVYIPAEGLPPAIECFFASPIPPEGVKPYSSVFLKGFDRDTVRGNGDFDFLGVRIHS